MKLIRQGETQILTDFLFLLCKMQRLKSTQRNSIVSMCLEKLFHLLKQIPNHNSSTHRNIQRMFTS